MIFASILLIAAVCNVDGARIVGGQPTSIEQYPTIVQVDFRTGIFWSQSCAASILNARFLLSAAHCFHGLLFNINSRRIRAGSSNRNTGGVVVRLDHRINHPSYRRSTLDGDISVLQMSSDLLFSNTIQPVPIIAQGFVLPDNLPVVHAGWGATSQGGLSSSILRDVTIYTINHQLCASRYQQARPPRQVTDNMICAGVLDEGGRDACQGDSGGPLYYGNILVGVVSWGQGCAHSFFPGVCARVASYTNWIVETAR